MDETLRDAPDEPHPAVEAYDRDKAARDAKYGAFERLPDETEEAANARYAAQVAAVDAANDRRARTIDGLRHIDDQIAFYSDALVYVRENGHGNAEGVLLRIVRDLETLRAVPLPLSDEEAAAQETDDPIAALQRDNVDLRRQLGQLQAVSPHGFVNTTRTLRAPPPPAPVDKAPVPPVNGDSATQQPVY